MRSAPPIAALATTSRSISATRIEGFEVRQTVEKRKPAVA
jgi:hypothetical protein